MSALPDRTLATRSVPADGKDFGVLGPSAPLGATVSPTVGTLVSELREPGFGQAQNDGENLWTTDKDGPIMDLLAAEITGRTGKDPGEHYRELTGEFGTSYYTRIDAPVSPQQKSNLQKLSPDAVKESHLAGEPITAKLTRAPGNNAPIGGLKVVAKSGWFAARPSGTANIYKIYVQSFKSQEHLNAIVKEAQEMVNRALRHS